MFADAGYDVWLSNSRGNYYSRRHRVRDPDVPSSSFWNYSYYEMGVHDFPAVIDYARRVTKAAKVFVVAYSQGTSAAMVLLSEKPEYNEYVAAISLLSPISYLNNSAPLYQVFGQIATYLKVNLIH